VNKTINVSLHSGLYTWVWWALRVAFALAFVFFIGIYYFTVVPSDYYVTGRALAAQLVSLAAFIVAGAAAGSPTRSIGLPALSICAIFALSAVSMLINLLADPQAIITYSEKYPDQHLHQLVSLLGPQGPVIVFMAWIVPANIVLLGGTIAAVALRWLRSGGTGRTLLQMDRDVRRAVARSGDAPSLLRLAAWSRWRGWLYGLAAVILLMTPAMLGGREFDLPAGGGWRNLLPDILARALVALTDRWLALIVALPLAFWLWRRARAHFVPTAQFVLDADHRPPILLLRSFEDDRAAVRATQLWRRMLLLNRLARHRLEEVAAATLRQVGPFIAVGDPRQSLPELGAFRASFRNDEWQGKVQEWMKAARVVVIIAGRGEGLAWELRTAAQIGALEKVVLLMPPGDMADQQARWRHAAESLAASPWATALQQLGADRILAATFASHGALELVKARRRREQDYDLALRIALHRVTMQLH
jgi:hypothetical protein